MNFGKAIERVKTRSYIARRANWDDDMFIFAPVSYTHLNPSVSFKWYSNKLIFRDFADYRYRGDVFEIVGLVLKKSCTNNKDFVEICSNIIEYASDVLNDSPYVNRVYQAQNKIINNEFRVITTVNRKMTFYDYRYYNQFGLSLIHILYCC